MECTCIFPDLQYLTFYNIKCKKLNFAVFSDIKIILAKTRTFKQLKILNFSWAGMANDQFAPMDVLEKSGQEQEQ